MLSMGLRPSTDTGPADWYVNADVQWYVKAAYGPPGLQTYARISVDRERQGEDDPPIETKILRSVLYALADHTTTPEQVHVGIWEGWGYPNPPGARFSIYARTYALLAGPVEHVLDYEAMGLDVETTATPRLIWPNDRTWFIAWDTDEEKNFTVAGSELAITAVLALPNVIGTDVPYGAPEAGWSW